MNLCYFISVCKRDIFTNQMKWKIEKARATVSCFECTKSNEMMTIDVCSRLKKHKTRNFSQSLSRSETRAPQKTNHVGSIRKRFENKIWIVINILLLFIHVIAMCRWIMVFKWIEWVYLRKWNPQTAIEHNTANKRNQQQADRKEPHDAWSSRCGAS